MLSFWNRVSTCLPPDIVNMSYDLSVRELLENWSEVIETLVLSHMEI